MPLFGGISGRKGIFFSSTQNNSSLIAQPAANYLMHARLLQWTHLYRLFFLYSFYYKDNLGIQASKWQLLKIVCSFLPKNGLLVSPCLTIFDSSGFISIMWLKRLDLSAKPIFRYFSFHFHSSESILHTRTHTHTSTENIIFLCTHNLQLS